MPLRTYLLVGLALLVLTLVTTEVGKHDFGAANLFIAMAIATVKALLVLFFFMHLWYDNKLFFIAFVIGLLTLTMFIVLTLFDTMSRGDVNPEVRHVINPRSEFYSAPGFGKGHHGEGEGEATGADSTATDTTGMAPDSLTFIDSTAVDSTTAKTDQSSNSH